MDHQLSTDNRITQRKTQKTVITKSTSHAALHSFKWNQSPAVAVEENQKLSCSSGGVDNNEKSIYPEVFGLQPEDIHKELLSSVNINSIPSTFTSQSEPTSCLSVNHVTKNKSFTDSLIMKETKKASDRVTTTTHQQPAVTCAFLGDNHMDDWKSQFPLSFDCDFPGNVDPKVFFELPPDVQIDLMSEWKQQKLVLKDQSSRKPGRSLMTKDRKAAGKGSQTNSLLKYFKPS